MIPIITLTTDFGLRDSYFVFQRRPNADQEDQKMTTAIRQSMRIQSDGVVEIRSPALAQGRWVDVIVLMESDEDRAAREERVQRLRALFKETQALPIAQTITEEEIAAEIEAYRMGR